MKKALACSVMKIGFVVGVLSESVMILDWLEESGGSHIQIQPSLTHVSATVHPLVLMIISSDAIRRDAMTRRARHTRPREHGDLNCCHDRTDWAQRDEMLWRHPWPKEGRQVTPSMMPP